MRTENFAYQPEEYEFEKASNAYLISLFMLILVLPLPIINLIGALIFYLGNKKSTPFVRWHCMQVILSQIFLLIINNITLFWTLFVLSNDLAFTSIHKLILSLVIFGNILELIATVYTTYEVKKGKHIKWLVFSNITDHFFSDDMDKKESNIFL
ncbi:DUF4870 domain-containing protein [Aureivirga marina]|uniref:DUF4870 domain-containing protein n=1 Tax=Aureivirga marina TaxID=1182451 RepID=UPI0018CAB279|nr:DUF4870 domain-containing protein [Aureivirga marina]